MGSFLNKALAYLGLKDVEDDEYYADEFEPDERGPQWGNHTVYPDRDGPEPAAPRSFAGAVRPVPPDEPAPLPASRPAIVRPLVPNRTPAAKVHVVMASKFDDAKEIADLLRDSNPVIVNLQESERDNTRRLVDFCSGLTCGVGGYMEKVAEQVFLLTPSNVEISPEERLRLQDRGQYGY
jgi:cell division inhibitor SepF